MATPFKATLVAQEQGTNRTKMWPLTASDVNDAAMLSPSGASEAVLNGRNDVLLTDLILSAAGTDTTQIEIFVGGVSTGIILLGATTIGTIYNRPLNLAPVLIPAGQTVQFEQLT